MYPWYYVWSPSYRIFHEVLQFGTRDLSGVKLNPICVPQKVFDLKVDPKERHFLTGIGIKIHCLLKALNDNADQFIVFSDVDLIVLDKDLSKKLKLYEKNDITAMREKKDGEEYNIGFMLIKSTEEVKALFHRVLETIRSETVLDQDAFNQHIKSFSGTHGFFDTKDFIQSNMIRKDIWDTGNYSIIQCLSAEQTTKEKILGKLATIVYFYDIRNLLCFVERDIAKSLVEHLMLINPNHHLCMINLDDYLPTYKTTENS